MKRFAIVLVAAAAVFGVSVWEQPSASADEECKTPGTCPLHDWMEKEMQEPMDAGDLKKVGASLEKIAGMSPDPAWNKADPSWEKLAKDGAAAAKAGDAKAVGASCKSCHKAFRKQYKEKFRTRPIK
jgi:hypothetical protein